MYTFAEDSTANDSQKHFFAQTCLRSKVTICLLLHVVFIYVELYCHRFYIIAISLFCAENSTNSSKIYYSELNVKYKHLGCITCN